MMRDALTPMMQQYRRLRKSIPADTLLLFRLGDFYELFFEDAKEASALLNVALTKRNGVPMCGVPYHAAQSYVAKLIKAGRRVASSDWRKHTIDNRYSMNWRGSAPRKFLSAMSRSSSSQTLPMCLGTTIMRF